MATDDWTEVNVAAELSENTGQLYAQMKAVYRQYKLAKEAFETAMQGDWQDQMPTGQELKFGYNFGKLSIAIGPRRERKASKAAARPSLVEWLQAQQAASART